MNGVGLRSNYERTTKATSGRRSQSTWLLLPAQEVGRASVLAKVQAFLNNTEANTLAVSGPAGSGKVELLREAIRAAGRRESIVEVDGQWSLEFHETQMRRLGAVNLDGENTVAIFRPADLATHHKCWTQSPVKKCLVFTLMPPVLAYNGPQAVPLRIYPFNDAAMKKVAAQHLAESMVEHAVRVANGDMRQLRQFINFTSQVPAIAASVDLHGDPYQIARSILTGKCNFDASSFEFVCGYSHVQVDNSTTDVLFENYLQAVHDVQHAARLAADLTAPMGDEDLSKVFGAHRMMKLPFSAQIKMPTRTSVLARNSEDPYRLIWTNGPVLPLCNSLATRYSAPSSSTDAPPTERQTEHQTEHQTMLTDRESTVATAVATAGHVLLTNKLHRCTMRRCDVVEVEGMATHIDAGGIVKNYGRGRHWLLVETDVDVKEAFQHLEPLFTAVHAFVNQHKTLCLVFKENRQGQAKLNQAYTLRAVDTGLDKQLKAEHVLLLWKRISGARCSGNICMQDDGSANRDEVPCIEDALVMYREAGFAKENWSHVHANALRAKRNGTADQLQTAILTYPIDMKDILNAMEDATPIVKKLSQPGKHFIEDFIKSEVLNLRGVHLVARGMNYTIETISLKELLWSKADRHGVGGLACLVPFHRAARGLENWLFEQKLGPQMGGWGPNC